MPSVPKKQWLRNCSFSFFFIYCMICALISLLLFLHGFFPLKKTTEDTSSPADFPTNVLNASFHVPTLYKKHVGRLVFVLIDAFRRDFLGGRMPYTNTLIAEAQACLLTARCHPPTATMPKIKALMTGSVPNYVDVALNLGSQLVKEDNLVHQAVRNGLKILFYGDETWLHLFPGMFQRSEGTTSFLVSDFQEVDLNVTRHINKELEADDWDVLILHYLGLDHIGHMSGPYSHLISPKLNEMDNVIKVLHRGLQEWDSHHPNEPSMIVVVGDHGMHDSGSHGGATLGEVLVSLVFIGKGCQNIQNLGQEVSQIDVTPTLAILLGLPIPMSNLGVLIPQALGQLSTAQYLYALHYNAHQVAEQFINSNPNGISEDSYQMYLKAQGEHYTWLTMGKEDSNLTDHIKALYTSSTQSMGDYLVTSLVRFDVMGMTVGCFLLVQVFIILLFYVQDALSWNCRGPQLILLFVCFLSNFMLLFLLCQLNESFSVLCSCEGISLFVPASFVVFSSFNSWVLLIFLSLQGFQLKKQVHFSSVSPFLLVGIVLHGVSLTASSFVEEEHQTWYFFWTTALLLLSRSLLNPNFKISCITFLPTISTLFGHRILRKLNQTGDKWAYLPDIGDWLNMPKHKLVLSSTAIVSMLCIWLCAVRLKGNTSTLDKTLYGITLICTLVYRASTGEIVGLWLYHTRDGLEVRLFWTLWVLILLKDIIQWFGKPSCLKKLRACIVLWLLLAALLMRPHNLPLLPSIVFVSSALQKFFPQVIDITILHAWLGVTWYFYQGNSNNLATIDVASGYVGIKQQNIIGSGILVAIHTLNAPVLAHLLLWYHLALQDVTLDRKHRNFSTSSHILFLQKLFSLTVCCTVVILHQHHLFVWSVFAPKLLYEAVSFICNLLLVFCCNLYFVISQQSVSSFTFIKSC